MTDNKARAYFEILADLGLTKHYGSLEATRELIDLCQIAPGKLVLDIGCGVGATPAYLAKTVGCRVIGMDLIEKMLTQAGQIARKSRLEELTAFLAGDARRLPFPDHMFDAVIMESVNVFFEDKLALFPEYIRITKPGGFIGITEMTWLRAPSRKLENLFREAAFVTALDQEAWTRILADAGLENVIGEGYQIDVSKESKSRMERYGSRYILKVLLKTARLLLTSSKHRSIFKDGTSGLTRDVLKTVGYGVYVGQKGLEPEI